MAIEANKIQNIARMMLYKTWSKWFCNNKEIGKWTKTHTIFAMTGGNDTKVLYKYVTHEKILTENS